MYRRELTWPQRGHLWLRLGIRFAIAVCLILFAWKAVPPLLAMFMPFVLALLAATALNPLVRWLQKRLGWSRRVLSLLVLLVIFGAISTALGLLARTAVLEVVALAENWESLLLSIEQAVVQLDQFLQELLAKLPFPMERPDQTLLEQLFVWLQGWLQKAAPDLGNLTAFARESAKDVSSFVLALVAFLMAAYFLSADYPYLRTRFIQRMDEGTHRLLGQVKAAAVAAFGGYLKAQILLTTGVFFILLGGFLLTDQSYALLIAVGLAMLDFVPLIGTGVVMVPWSLIALFTGRYEASLSVILIWGVVAVFRRLAEPKIVGNQTGLSPVLSLISIYVGMRLAGVVGMILGPILTLMVQNLLGLGLLDGTRADVVMAVTDVLAILNNGRQGEKDTGEAD